MFFHSSNNYCLKYVDASFYQIARGLVLPLTVFFSVLFLRNARPPIRIFVACGVVTIGFFVGVLLDGSHDSRGDGNGPSLLGISFGILSSMTTAVHAVVIKKSLEVVNGDAIELSWYSNILSSVLLLPLIVLAGEVPDIFTLISAPVFSATGNNPLNTFLWGSVIAVNLVPALRIMY
jgi:solute carrier family 35 (GDP-fucose transporter), member C1